MRPPPECLSRSFAVLIARFRQINQLLHACIIYHRNDNCVGYLKLSSDIIFDLWIEFRRVIFDTRSTYQDLQNSREIACIIGTFENRISQIPQIFITYHMYHHKGNSLDYLKPSSDTYFHKNSKLCKRFFSGRDRRKQISRSKMTWDEHQLSLICAQNFRNIIKNYW